MPGQGDTALGTQLITGERRLVFIQSWLQVDRRRDREGECERTVGTGRWGTTAHRHPRGAPGCAGQLRHRLGDRRAVAPAHQAGTQKAGAAPGGPGRGEAEFGPLTSAVSACTWPLCVCLSGEQRQGEEKIRRCSKRRKEKRSKRQVVKGSVCQMEARDYVLSCV